MLERPLRRGHELGDRSAGQHTVGYQQARHADGLPWSRLAEVELAQLGVGENDLRRARALNVVALVRNSMGNYEEAVALHRRTLAIDEALLGPDHLEVATALADLALVIEQLGDYAEAKALHERALAIRERTLGPEHPAIATSYNNLANVLLVLGEHAEAEPMFRAALAIYEAALGPDHPNVASTLNGLGITLRSTGRYTEAKALFERAAVDSAERAVELCERGCPPERLAEARFVLAQALWGAPEGDRERALGLAREAREGLRGVVGNGDELAEIEAFLAGV